MIIDAYDTLPIDISYYAIMEQYLNTYQIIGTYKMYNKFKNNITEIRTNRVVLFNLYTIF